MSKIMDKRNSFDMKNITIWIFLILVTFVVFYYHARHVDLRIAWGGCGPQNYVAEKLYPENFKNDFHSGIMEYDHSLPMRVYYYLAKYFHIFPSVSVYPLMFLQTLLLVFAVYYLGCVMFKNRLIAFLCAIAVLVGTLPGLNLARFGNGFGQLASYALYHTFADAFWIFAIAFSLRKHYIAAFILLALSTYCHPIMGLFAFVFICSYILFKRQLLLEKKFKSGLFLFIILVAPYLILTGKAGGIISSKIPTEAWFIQTRSFCCHWYPFAMKMFSKRAMFIFLPFVFLCLFYFIALRYQNFSEEKNRKIIIGSCACIVLTALGIFFSKVAQSPFIIKIVLHRSSIMVSLFGVLYIINYLYQKVITQNFLIGIVAVFCYVIMLFGQPGIAFLPIFILTLNDIHNKRLGPIYLQSRKKTGIVFLIISGIFFLFSFLTIAQNIIGKETRISWILSRTWTPLRCFNPLASFDLMCWGGAPGFSKIHILIMVAIFSFIFALGKKKKKQIISLIACLLLLTVVTLDAKREDENWMKRYADKAKSYLDVQVWAKNNTRQDALFAPDPTHYYGWRDFSERSSFGNVREWGYTCLAYLADIEAYEEGRKRCQEFNINLAEVTEEDAKREGLNFHRKFTKIARNVYYNMTYDKIKYLSSKYGIDYFIVEKARYNEVKNKGFSKLPIVYQNKHYTVYAAQPIRQR